MATVCGRSLREPTLVSEQRTTNSTNKWKYVFLPQRGWRVQVGWQHTRTECYNTSTVIVGLLHLCIGGMFGVSASVLGGFRLLWNGWRSGRVASIGSFRYSCRR